MLAIPGRCIMIEIFCTGKSWMRIHISGWQIDDFGMLRSWSVTGWGGWRAGRPWCQLWSLLPASVGWRSRCSFTSPACLGILRSAMLARKAAGCVVLTKHSRVTLYRSLHLVIPKKHNTPHYLFSDLAARFLNKMFHFLFSGAQKAFCGHFGHIQCQAHGSLFQLYPTSLPCRSCSHVENLQDISCYF
jgi:hypothetical protein